MGIQNFDHSHHKLKIRGLQSPVDVLTFEGREQLSTPFRYDIQFTSTDKAITPELVLMQDGAFSLTAPPVQRLSAQLDALDPAEQIAMMRIKGRQLKSDPDWRNRSGSILKKQYARRDILKNRVWERSPSIKSVSVELKTEAIRRMKNRKVVGEKVQDIADDLNVSLSRLYHWLKM